MLEPDVPEYLVDYCLVGDKRDDPNRASAPRAEQGIFHPDHPDGPGSTYAPRIYRPLRTSLNEKNQVGVRRTSIYIWNF